MITGKLSNGFEVEVNEKKVKTYAFTRLLGKAASSNNDDKLYANGAMLSFLVGEEQEEALVAYVEEETGEEATTEQITALTLEIINLMKAEDEQIKKSSSSDE